MNEYGHISSKSRAIVFKDFLQKSQRERNIRTTFKATVFLRSSKSAGFSPLLRNRKKRARFSNSVKKRGFQSCSYISFPLESRFLFYETSFDNMPTLDSRVIWTFCFIKHYETQDNLAVLQSYFLYAKKPLQKT